MPTGRLGEGRYCSRAWNAWALRLAGLASAQQTQLSPLVGSTVLRQHESCPIVEW